MKTVARCGVGGLSLAALGRLADALGRDALTAAAGGRTGATRRPTGGAGGTRAAKVGRVSGRGFSPPGNVLTAVFTAGIETPPLLYHRAGTLARPRPSRR